jgi:hypothetical protein
MDIARTLLPWVALAAAGLAVFAFVQAAEPPAAAPPPCSAHEHRQFDFWIGEWEVTARGNVAGRNTIRPLMGGCVLHEHWRGARGLEGQSFNLYDAATGRWHQTWVDGNGTLLLLEGGLVEGSMVLEGDRPGPQGGTVRNRITWSLLPDGAVRQLWERSSDGGATWAVAFDGLYRRPEPEAGGAGRD